MGRLQKHAFEAPRGYAPAPLRLGWPWQAPIELAQKFHLRGQGRSETVKPADQFQSEKRPTSKE